VRVPIIVVTSNAPGEGKTGVATAIARHFAYRGTAVQLVRLASPDGAAVADAAYFESLEFVPGSPGNPSAIDAVRDPGGSTLTVVEADATSAGSIAGAKTVVVSRDKKATSVPEGVQPVAFVVTDVDGLQGVRDDASAAPLVIELGEDRTLAGFSVSEAKAAIHADVLVPGDGDETTCDYLVIAPIASDAGQPYFQRFNTQAVVVRFDKTDMHLAAMQASPECLILTGGRRPSDYLFDAASAKGIPVLLSQTDTENTVIGLEGVFDRTRFQGQRKLDRMCELLESTGLFAALS
jgi:BioD-like phosphotransacetylase family protein